VLLVPPELLDEPGLVEGIEGEEAVIRCRASGMPTPSFSFFKVVIVLLFCSKHFNIITNSIINFAL